MEIATGLMGLGLTVLGIVFAYIWKSNGRIQTYMMSALERIEKGQEESFKSMEEGFKSIAKGQEESFKSMEGGFKSMEGGFKSIAKGQEESFKSITEGQERIAEMLLNQTKILERIEGKIS